MRIYRVPFSGTLGAAGGDADLLYIAPADDKVVELIGFKLGQTSELGDAAEENVGISIIHLPATVTVGSGGAAVTPRPVDQLEVAAGFTARCNDTTIATTNGTLITLEEFAWNIRASPYEWWCPEEMRIRVRQTEALIIRLQTTPADDIVARNTFYIAEH